MRKIYYIVISLFFTSCSDFLDTENLTQKDSSNFPVSETDLMSVVTSAFSDASNFENNNAEINQRWRENVFFLSEMMSDDRLGGGRVSAIDGRAIMNFQQTDTDMHLDAWKRSYEGIYKTNFLFENIDKVTYSTEENRKKILGQAYFLRALFYFDFARLFGANVPKILTTDVDKSTPQAKPDEIYSLIMSDLVEAIEILPSVKFEKIPISDNGMATKWAAEAYLARVFLFYTGYYNKESINLVDGSELTKSHVQKYLIDCIDNSGHGLIDDFRTLWPYSISNKDYPYAIGLEYAGDENKEVVFALKYSYAGFRSTSNMVVLAYGLSNQTLLPYGKGWMYGTVNPKIWNDWPDNDLRKRASIWNVLDQNEGVVGYKLNNGNTMQETNYYNKKYMPITVKNSKGQIKNYAHVLYGAIDNFNLNNCQDLILMRFSDVLLMAAELECPKAQDYYDRVRGRVGLQPKPVSLDNIKEERRFELAFEGIRYWDLLRWHDAERVINENMKDIPVITLGKETSVTVKFRTETGGFLAIPNSEILLSNGVLKQNPGWDTNDAFYVGE